MKRGAYRSVIAAVLAVAALGIGAGPASADGPVGNTGWYVDNHWTWDEWLANRDVTRELSVGGPGRGCSVIPHTLLQLYCRAQLSYWQRTASEAMLRNHCFRIVVPGHNPNWAYPSTYYRPFWC